jgi:hypothetical protein
MTLTLLNDLNYLTQFQERGTRKIGQKEPPPSELGRGGN